MSANPPTRPHAVTDSATPLPGWFAAFVARPRVSRFALRLATLIDRPLMRATRGRLRLSFVIPLLLLRVRGARTGALREVPLLYVPDGEAFLLVASNGGQQPEPAWAHNLRAAGEATCVLGGREVVVNVEELSGEARARAWAAAVTLYPGYARYAERVSRTIAVFHLTPTTIGA